MIYKDVDIICGDDCHQFTIDFQPDEKILWEPDREVVRYTSRNLDDIIAQHRAEYNIFATRVKLFRV